MLLLGHIAGRPLPGRDALSKLLDYLYENREDFNGYYMYAHNGGAFDFTVLMNDCLLNHDKWRINCSNNAAIEQSGSWISAVLETKAHGKKYSITMRDSVRMLPGTLDSLTKELKEPSSSQKWFHLSQYLQIFR